MNALRELIRRLGAVDATLFVIDRLLARVTGGRVRLLKYYFMAQPVPPASKPTTRANGIAIEEMRPGDPRFAGFERSAEELDRRFATGGRCFAAWQGDTLAGFLWFTDHEYAEDEVRCRFRVNPGDQAVWDLDVHIVPRFRLGRTFALLWDRAFDAMRADGVRWTLSRVASFNAESIRAHQRLGARRSGWSVFLLVGSYQFTLDSLGRLKGRRLEHGLYPVMEIRAPAPGASTDGTGLREEPELAGSGRSGGRGLA